MLQGERLLEEQLQFMADLSGKQRVAQGSIVVMLLIFLCCGLTSDG